MKKTIVVPLMIFAALFFVVLSCFAEDIIYGCYQKNNGQLRIVNDASECRPSEKFIQWNEAGPAGPQGVPGVSLDLSKLYSKHSHSSDYVACDFDDVSLSCSASVYGHVYESRNYQFGYDASIPREGLYDDQWPGVCYRICVGNYECESSDMIITVLCLPRS